MAGLSESGFSSDDAQSSAMIAARAAVSVVLPEGLALDGVPLAAIAQRFGTPTHVFGADSLAGRAQRLTAAMPGVAIHYAVKANDQRAILSRIASLGLGADVVSLGEMQRALAAGFVPEKIVFSGVGKTSAELSAALDAGIGQINVESPEELSLLGSLAAARGVRAPVALRVNPDIDAGTHDKISTGRAGDKFGIAHDLIVPLYLKAASEPGIRLMGLAVHIGSQVFAAEAFGKAYARLASLVERIRAGGGAVELIDCGGGLGVSYCGEPALLPEAWFGAMQTHLGGLGVKLAIEPGRWLVAQCGLLLSRVIRVRHEGMARPMAVLDAAMNDFLRPAMYGAAHGILPVCPVSLQAQLQPTDFVGPVCESSDVFARARLAPALADGDLVAILDTGAYGSVMQSRYNARAAAAQVLVAGGVAHLIRPRGGSDLWDGEMLA